MEMKRIRSPRELASSIKVIKSNISEGTLREGEGAQDIFDEIEEIENWPDILNNEFHCQTCDQRFLLSVETYHGAGGFWDSLD
jgi:hypothetical protein